MRLRGTGSGTGSGTVSPAEAVRLVRRAFPSAHALYAEPLSGGRRRTIVKVELEGAAPVVVRIYGDAATCRREIAVLGALPAVVPVPAMYHAAPDDEPPWALFSFVEGGPFDRALQKARGDQVDLLASDVGAVLSAVHRVRFPRAGMLGPDLTVIEPLPPWSESMRRLLAAGAGDRLGRDLAWRLQSLVAANAPEMDALYDDPALCHGDLGFDNVLARLSSGTDDRSGVAGTVRWGAAASGTTLFGTDDRPRLAAIVDWECAFAGPPLIDVGAFLRQSDSLPPGLAEAFAAGYRRWDALLPPGWRRLARRLDLVGLCTQALDCDEPKLARIRGLVSATLTADS